MLELALKEMALEGEDLGLEREEVHGPFKAGLEPAALNGLDEVIEGARLHAIHSLLYLVHGRHYDNGHHGVAVGDIGEELLPRDMRHGEVEDHCGDLLLREKRQHLPCVVEGDDLLHPGAPEHYAVALEYLRLIVHKEDGQRRLGGPGCHRLVPFLMLLFKTLAGLEKSLSSRSTEVYVIQNQG